MPLEVMCIGAHPDDVEGSMGGTASLFRKRGDHVTIISVTDGGKGHYFEEYINNPEALAHRRLLEAQAASKIIGANYHTMGISDGELYINAANTEEMIRVIRSCGERGRGPELVITNRPNDYHRDHRYTAQLVLDASYMLTVPAICPDVQALSRMPVIAYWQDDFNEGGAFRADVVIDIEIALEAKARMTSCHQSQYFEWLPFNSLTLDEVPSCDEDRYKYRLSAVAERAQLLGQRYMNRPNTFVEAFQISEYGRQCNGDELSDLFPMQG